MPFGHQIGPGDFMGGLPGIAVFDYDGDEDLDIYITNGEGFPNRLLQNDGQANFIDVASISGVDDRGRGHGVATADIDNDGDLDLYVANDGPNKLYLNNGNGKFTDIAPSAGVVSKSNSTACAFADIDNDGYVDLYLGAADQFSGYGSNILYRNKGDLSFTDITDQTGTHGGYSWAVGFCDYDNDGDQDIFTANDQGLARKEESCQIMLYRNDINLVSGGGATRLRFAEVTEQAGFDKTGSWMGLAFGDYDLDGDFDLFATNLGTSFQFEAQDTDYHSLYRNNGDGTFTDVAEALSLAQWEFGWGTVFTDFDNDGDCDLYYVGNFLFMDVTDNPGRFFLNNGDGTFSRPMAKQYGILTQDKDGNNTIAVGLATGDLNNDGHIDLVVANAGTEVKPAYPVLYNHRFDNNNWLQVRLEGTRSNRSAIGARVTVITDERKQIQEVASGASSLSQSSFYLSFGLGKASRIDSLEVRWPSGIIQKFQSIKTNRIIKIQEHNPRFLVDVEPQSQSWSKLANIKSSAQMDLMFGLAYNGRWHYPHSLYQNYPNPFNPETWIPYQLAMDAKVAVSIYDMNSVLVHRIDLGLQKSGYYFSRESAAHWNGRNMNGEQVASGIYFYRLQVSHPTSSTESQTPLRKMIILN